MNNVDLSKYDNSWYNPGSILKRVLWMIFGRIFVNTYLPIPIFIKVFVLKIFGAEIGKGVVIKPKVNIKYPWFLIIGDFSWIGECVWIDNLTKVKIGKHSCISQGAMLLTGNHDYKSPSFDLIVKEIAIKNGVWIGAKSLIAPGVVCENGTVIGACSLVSKSIPENEVWGGNPAKFIRKRNII